MTLVLKLDLDIIKMYVCTKNEVPTFSGSKVQHRQTDGQTDWNYYLPHTRMVISEANTVFLWTFLFHYSSMLIEMVSLNYFQQLIQNIYFHLPLRFSVNSKNWLLFVNQLQVGNG